LKGEIRLFEIAHNDIEIIISDDLISHKTNTFLRSWDCHTDVAGNRDHSQYWILWECENVRMRVWVPWGSRRCEIHHWYN
jgi:hypothetical protein